MTIKELEQRTGVTRTNIRFYESQGLLCPKRLDNGYRDYSGEDVRTLEKILLLRALRLDIDTIRRIQRQETSLAEALDSLGGWLQREQASLGRAEEVCRELGSSGADYASLDPKPWLKRLEEIEPLKQEPAPDRSAREPEEEQEELACWHPWQRWLARGLDIGLYQAGFYVFWAAFIRRAEILRTGPFLNWLVTLALLFFALLLEPVWLHFWGWTPGKWLLGLKVRDKQGRKLSLKQAFRRSMRVGWEGYGWHIPLWNLWRLWQCRKTSLDCRRCPWDGEEDFRYTKEERRWGGWAMAAGYLAAVTVGFVSLLWCTLPVYTGELTVAEFADNYNQYHTLLAGRDSVVGRMGPDGAWEKETDTGNLFGGNTFIVEWGETQWAEPEFRLEEGAVTAITLRMETDRPVLTQAMFLPEILSMLALAGVEENLAPWNLDLEGWQRFWIDRERPWDSFSAQYRGLSITQAAEYSGYADDGSGWLIAGDNPHYEKAVTIAVVGK